MLFPALISDFRPSFLAIDLYHVKSIMAKYNNRLMAFIYHPSILFVNDYIFNYRMRCIVVVVVVVVVSGLQAVCHVQIMR